MLTCQACFESSLLKGTWIQAGHLNCFPSEKLTTGGTTGLLHLVHVMLAQLAIHCHKYWWWLTWPELTGWHLSYLRRFLYAPVPDWAPAVLLQSSTVWSVSPYRCNTKCCTFVNQSPWERWINWFSIKEMPGIVSFRFSNCDLPRVTSVLFISFPRGSLYHDWRNLPRS